MHKLGQASVQARTIGDLRRQFGPSQSAFASLCGITQAQVSMLENGKVLDPRAQTIERIAKACDVTPETVRDLLQETQARLADESIRMYHELEQMTRDLYPRVRDTRRRDLLERGIPGEVYPGANESARLNLAAQALALGRRAFEAAASGAQVNWLALGGVANDLYRDTNAQSWQEDRDLAVSRAAFRMVREMCRDFDEGQIPDTARWHEGLRALIRDANEASANAIDLDIRWIGTDLLAMALREPIALMTGLDEFSAAWSDLIFGAADTGHELAPIQLQVSAVANLLKGVRLGVEDRRAA